MSNPFEPENLADVFYDAASGGRRHEDASMSLPEMLAELVRIAGSGAKAAKLVGVSHTSFNRWRRGVQKPKAGADAVRQALRRQYLPAGKEKQIRTGALRLSLTATDIRVSSDSRPRTIRVGSHIPLPLMGRVVTAWLKGDDKRVENTLRNAIDKHYVPGMTIDGYRKGEFK